MKKIWIAGCVAGAAAMIAVPAALGQNSSSQGGLAAAQGHATGQVNQHEGTVYGHAQNPLGQPIANANVFATTNGSPQGGGAMAHFVTDANGDYRGAVTYGTYIMVLQDPANNAKEIDDVQGVKVPEGGEVQANFDGTREAYMKKLTPEQKKIIEETKAKNAQVMAANSQIKNLNATLLSIRDARKAGNCEQAMTLSTQITQAKPEASVGWFELGASQLCAKKYPDAQANLKKALDINAATAKPDPQVTRAANALLGDAYLAQGKNDDAAAAYDAGGKAAETPQAAGLIYVNAAAGFFNKNATAQMLDMAEKAIAADPTIALAYYLKAQALVTKATTDASGKIVVPPGTVEAYNKYLDLEPNGEHAEEVAQVLQGIGAKVSTSYHAKH
jgi:tetratricopeptide (TPR) repeat protein